MKNTFVLSAAFCLHNKAVVIEEKADKITIGLLHPDDDDLKMRLCRAVEKTFATEEIKVDCEFILIDNRQFHSCIESLFKKRNDIAFKKDECKDEKSVILENEAAVLFESLILKATSLGATDIHIEEKGVRFRISGQLEHEIELDEKTFSALVQRIKLLAKLNVFEKRRGQDGSFTFISSDKSKIFIRVSALPAVSEEKDGIGESLVLRLLDTKRIPLKLENLGYSEKGLNLIKSMCSLQDGLVLVCGPTGSGKSTSAAAMLERIRNTFFETKKIISLEDPIEYLLPGVTQVQVNKNHDMDFAESLRRVFRQDPDVIMIGEIRDAVTAKTALQAAMTGHLVIATLHTGSVSQSLLRLQELGAKEVLVKSVLKGLICQRLHNGKLEAEAVLFDENKSREKLYA